MKKTTKTKSIKSIKDKSNIIKPLNILCLHGMCQDSEVFKSRISRITKKLINENIGISGIYFNFIDAPYMLDKNDGDDVAMRTWYTYKTTNSVHDDNVKTSNRSKNGNSNSTDSSCNDSNSDTNSNGNNSNSDIKQDVTVSREVDIESLQYSLNYIENIWNIGVQNDANSNIKSNSASSASSVGSVGSDKHGKYVSYDGIIGFSQGGVIASYNC